MVIVRTKKKVVIQEHLFSLLVDMVSDLKTGLIKRNKELSQIKRMIEQAKITRIQTLTDKILQDAKEKVSNAYSNISLDYTSYKYSCITKSDEIISMGGSLSNFKTNEGPKIETIMKIQSQQYIYGINQNINDIQRVCSKILNSFKKEFENHYSNFSFLTSSISSDYKVSNLSIPNVNFNDAIEYITQREQNEDTNAKWGAGSGAILGTFILPGVGTVIGTILGAFVSFFFADDDEKRQKEVKEQTRKGILDFFIKLKDSTETSLNKSQKSIIKQLEKICNNHIKEYGKKIESLIIEQENKLKTLNAEIDYLNRTLVCLEDLEDNIKLEIINLKLK